MNIDLTFLVQISRLFIPLVAIAGVYIAWHQYTTNREKIRFELFEKRFNIYNSILQTLNALLWEEGLSREKFHSFVTTCNEAQFLLPDDVFEDVQNIRELVSKWYVCFIESNRKDTDKHNNELLLLEGKLEKLTPALTKSFSAVLNFKKF